MPKLVNIGTLFEDIQFKLSSGKIYSVGKITRKRLQAIQEINQKLAGGDIVAMFDQARVYLPKLTKEDADNLDYREVQKIIEEVNEYLFPKTEEGKEEKKESGPEEEK